MKDLFKKIVKPVLIVSLLILFSCEKDLYEDQIKKDHNNKTQLLTGKEAEKIAIRLKNLLGSDVSLSNSEFGRTITLEFGTINYEEILMIIDSYGKDNYTFQINYPEKSDTKFANLVLQEKDTYTTIKVIEYNMTEQFTQQYKLGADITQFKGYVKITPIFSDNPCPEQELIIQIGNVSTTTSGGGGSWDPNNGNIPGGNSGGGGSGYNDLTLAAINTDDGSNQDDNDETGEWDSTTDWHSKLSIIKVSPSDPNTPIDSTDPCPQTTQIGILLPVDTCSKSFLDGLGSGDREWLYAHNDEHNDIMNYIASNSNCNEANQVATEILKEQKRGSKVDYENKIIIDSSFVTNQKAMCVYNKMRNINAFNKALAPFETTTPVAFLKLMTEDMGNNGRAVTEPPLDNLNIITIKINNNATSHDGINYQANLLLAQTIIHEVIHAELFRKIMIAISVGSYVGDPVVVRNALSSSQFDVLSEYFRQGHDWPHSFMADHMRNTIARVTEEFANGLSVTTPSPYYKTLAWRGLMHYGTVTSWTQIVGLNPDIPSPEAIDIDQTIYNYETTHANENCQ